MTSKLIVGGDSGGWRIIVKREEGRGKREIVIFWVGGGRREKCGERNVGILGCAGIFFRVEESRRRLVVGSR